MWRVIKNMYAIARSAVLLEGEKSKQFHIGQGVAQVCHHPILSISMVFSKEVVNGTCTWK